jgi:RNA polymerase sigma-70 factor, ECF subfamily
MADHVAAETGLVTAAAAGDHEAFRMLVEPIRRELHLLSYRMLGSFHDAEDVLQDAQLKAWRSLSAYDGRASFRTWMFKVVMNTSLDALRTRRRRVLPQDIGSAKDPGQGLGEQRLDIAWLEPYPDSLLPNTSPEAAAELRESVRLAFVRALQILPPRQRAVLIMRDVLDWTASEVADALGTSVAAVNSALQRARATAAPPGGREGTAHNEGAPAPASAPALDAQKAEIAARYVQAWEAGDIDAIVSMLTADAVHAMPPWAAWFAGREALRVLYAGYRHWKGRPGPGVFRILPTGLNGELGFAEYARERPDRPYTALAFTVVTLNADGTRVAEKVSFVQPDLLVRSGFPPTLE